MNAGPDSKSFDGFDQEIDPIRRALLQASAGAALCAVACSGRAPPGVEIHDAGRFETMRVAAEQSPVTTEDVRRSITQWPGPLSIGGGRYSMGGQIAAEGTLHLDMREMSRLVRLDPEARVVRAQAGMRWRDLQELIDPYDLSIAVMQSYSNFTLGGSVSVNCHGRYVGRGPIVNTLRALQLITADGQVRELSRDENSELFAAVVGGYGGLGVVTEVELDLDTNFCIERRVESVALEDYPEFFRTQVLSDPAVVLHNADLTPPDYDHPFAISWRRSDQSLTDSERLTPRDANHLADQALIWAASELPVGENLRASQQQAMLSGQMPVVWRNREASLDTDSLEPATRSIATYALQEYFVPVAQFLAFARRMSEVLLRHRVNALNVSIRHSPADSVSLLRWASEEVFCFVLYYKQYNNDGANRAVETWSRELIDAAIACGGRYYLPYRLHATLEQFATAYPEASRFSKLKREIDPKGRFRNKLWDKYLGAVRASG